MRCMWSTLLS